MSQESGKVSDSFWPSLKKKLEQDTNNFSRLDIECQICFDPTTIPEEPYGNPSSPLDHRACILPCGHIFGDECIAKYLRACEAEGSDPKCPTCRAKLQHAKCQHACLGVPMPHCPTLVSTVLPTLSEGGKISEACCMCDLHAVVGYAIREVVRTSAVPAGHFICASADLPGYRFWVKPAERRVPQDAEVEGELYNSEVLQEYLDELERRLSQKHLHEWCTGDLTGLELELHLYTNERA